jgi:hypothetical protein
VRPAAPGRAHAEAAAELLALLAATAVLGAVTLAALLLGFVELLSRAAR